MKGRRKLLLWLAVGVIIAVALVLLWQGLRGQGFRMLATHRVKALLDRTPAQRQGDFTNVVFLHHSTGRNLINQGKVRQRLTEAGFQFWDHDYNWEGLIQPSGARTGYSYGIPGDNTDPDGLAQLFAQRVYPWPLNAFSGLMQHEVITFKSCFPASNITGQEELEQYKAWYLEMREVMDRYPDHIFIAVTPPPLNPTATTPQAAARARAFADWLKSDEYLAEHPNVFTFDLFDLLAEREPSAPDFNMLRASYRQGEDSHPNEPANQIVGPLFADFVVEATQTFRARLAGGDKTP